MLGDTFPRTRAESQSIRKSGVDWHYSATLMQTHAIQLEHELAAAKKEIEEMKRDKERLDWLEAHAVEIGISALAYHEISATRAAIDKGMREIKTRPAIAQAKGAQ